MINFNDFFKIILLCYFFILSSCSSSTSEKEIDLKIKELEFKEKQIELQQRSQSESKSTSVDKKNFNSSSMKKKDFKSFRQKSEDEMITELYTKEKKKPKDYLNVDYRLNYKVFSGKDEIIGTIYNSANFASFKDIVLTITYSTNTNTELYREEFIVYEYVSPGSSSNFKIKTFSPEGTKKIGVFVKDAVGE